MKRKRPAAPVTAAVEQPAAPEAVQPSGLTPLELGKLIVFSLLLLLAMTIQTGRMSMVLIAAALVLSLPTGKKPLAGMGRYFCVPVLGLLAFALLNGLAAIYSPFDSDAVNEFYKIITATALCGVLLARFEKKHVRGLLWGFSAVIAVIALVSIDMASDGLLFRGFDAIASLLGEDYSSVEQNLAVLRVGGLYNDANVTASIFGLGTLAALYLTDTAQSRRDKLPACELLGISALGFLLSMSRGAILCFALALLVWLLAAGRENRLRLFVLMLLTALVTVVLAVPAMASIGKLAPVPLLLALAAGPLMFLLLRSLDSLLAKVLEKRKKLAVGLLAGLLACCVAYAVAGTLVTGPYTMGAEDTLQRVVTLEPGTYTVSGAWEGEVTLLVSAESRADILMFRQNRVYQGPLEGASFTIPEGTEQVRVWFYGEQGDRLEAVALSDGTEIPLGYPLLPDFIVNRLQGSIFSDSSFLLRAQYMKDAWTLFTQSPLLGHGLASTEGLYTSVQPFYYESLYVHNHILQVMSDMGLLGLLAFLLLLVGSVWLLLKNLRSGESGPLAAMLLAGWVLMNAHSAMEINFSIRAYQCAALMWLLLPALLFARPVSGKKVVQWGGLAVFLLLWLYLAAFGFLLERHRMVQREMAEFSTTSASEFMETTRRFVKQDVFVQEQNKLNFAANAAILQNPAYNGEKIRWVQDLREGGTYTACSGLARYYYLRLGEYEELFDCSRQGIAQEASTKEAWNLQFDFYRTDVLSAITEEDVDVYLDGVLATEAYWASYNQGRIEEIQLSEENEAFLNLVSTIREQGLTGQQALTLLSVLLDG